MEPEKTVFISYSQNDAAVAQQICEALERAQVWCWIAPRDVPAGTQYGHAITVALRAARVLVVVFSRAAAASPSVLNEVELANSLRLPIFVCRIDRTDPRETAVGFFVGSRQWFDDAIDSAIERHAARLARSVKDLRDSNPPLREANRQSPAETRAPRRAREVPKALPPGQRYIGIDVGSSNVRGCVRDIAHPDVPSPREAQYIVDIARPASPRSVLDQTQAMIRRILEQEHFGRHPPAGIGIAVPGQVDVRAGTLKFSPGLGVRNVPFGTRLAQTYPGVRIRVDNDARCATRCELHLGTGREYHSFVCIFVGTGVGSGLALNRRVYFGEHFCAGEVGHMKIDASGPICTCGQIGCLEAFVKGPAIAALAHAKAVDCKSKGVATLLGEHELLDARKVAQAVEAGDEAAMEVVNEVGAKFGLGIANYLNVINPGAVVLGGGVMTGFFLHMIDSITQAVKKNAIAEMAYTPIIQSQFTDDGAALGAALMFHPQERWPVADVTTETSPPIGADR